MTVILRFLRAERGDLDAWLRRKFMRLAPPELKTLEETWDYDLEKDKA